jgi:hypothetical protein
VESSLQKISNEVQTLRYSFCRALLILFRKEIALLKAKLTDWEQNTKSKVKYANDNGDIFIAPDGRVMSPPKQRTLLYGRKTSHDSLPSQLRNSSLNTLYSYRKQVIFIAYKTVRYTSAWTVARAYFRIGIYVDIEII